MWLRGTYVAMWDPCGYAGPMSLRGTQVATSDPNGYAGPKLLRGTQVATPIAAERSDHFSLLLFPKKRPCRRPKDKGDSYGSPLI